MKVLLVDDTLTDRMVVTAFLTKMGHEVLACENGEEGVQLFKEEQPELILLDVIMPVMDGYRAARKIRSLGDQWVPIIFLSGKTSPDDIAAGIEAGGDDYLTKPVDQIVLSAKMQAMQRIVAMRQHLLAVSLRLEEVNEELLRLVDVDGLTGLSNRRHLDHVLEQEYGRMARNRTPLSVVMADIDHFKAYNDHFGHLGGDDCLKTVAASMQAAARRAADLVARYGGEEFCVVLPETDLEGAVCVAEQLRSAIEELGIPQSPKAGSSCVTMSLGVASCIPTENTSLADLLKEADAALYKAKQEGRNRVQQIQL